MKRDYESAWSSVANNDTENYKLGVSEVRGGQNETEGDLEKQNVWIKEEALRTFCSFFVFIYVGFYGRWTTP